MRRGHYTTYQKDDELTLPVMRQRVEKFLDEFYNEAGAAGEQIANELKEYADQRHRWKNRTGQTEESTQAWTTADNNTIAAHLSAGTYYAQFLEWARQGRWAWLAPTMLEMQPRIKQIWKDWLGG